MPLDEYKRKRHFDQTPEPPAKIESQGKHRFVVQKHRASHLHYDFRLEMEGVLKSWAVPKGPSLDPADKRLAMMVEDHPVSYFDFEGIIPPGNYGAGTVMVWDMGTWVSEGDASEMLKKGDLKFTLYGEKLKGSFVLAHMRSRRPGSKGNEWLLIKHRDEQVVPEYDIDKFDYSVLTHRSLAEIAGDKGAAEWQSSRPAAVSNKNEWLADAIAKHDKQAAKASASTADKVTAKATSTKKVSTVKASTKKSEAKSATAKEHTKKGGTRRAASSTTSTTATASTGSTRTSTARRKSKSDSRNSKSEDTDAASVQSASGAKDISQPLVGKLESLEGARRTAMPSAIRPMLATLVDETFNDADWLYEIKWDGYRAIAFMQDGKVRLVSRNQNDLTAQYPELADLARHVRAHDAIVDGEVCALDEEGRSSFSLMQQRTGGLGRRWRPGAGDHSVPIVYYAFDLLYLDGFDLRRVNLEERKNLLREGLVTNERVRYSEHFPDGIALYGVAKERGLEGIIAKRREGCYLEKRTREWLKMKITQRQECVIGGYTDPRGSREHFGSIVLGLYDQRGRLIHVGQAGSGFTETTHAAMWQRLKRIETTRSPFHNKVEANRPVHWVKPEMVAEIKFTEWTHEGQNGGIKMRAPVYEGLRQDKPPSECVFEEPRNARREAQKAEQGEAA